MKHMTHGIVIISKDQPWQLHHILYSLKYQTVLPNEVVIINNNSTKKYKINKKNYPFKIKYKKITNKKLMKNRSHARNVGYKMCKTDTITFLDGDNIIDSHYIENVKKFFIEHPRALIVGVRFGIHPFMISPDMIKNDTYEEKYFPSLGFCLEEIPFEKIYSSNLSLPKDKKMGLPFDERFYGWGFEDTEMGYRYWENEYELYRWPILICSHFEHLYGPDSEEKKAEVVRNGIYFIKKYPYDPLVSDLVKKQFDGWYMNKFLKLNNN